MCGSGKLFVSTNWAVASMVDLPVLTEAAEQITVGKKNSSRAIHAYEGPLLAEVGTGGVDFELRG